MQARTKLGIGLMVAALFAPAAYGHKHGLRYRISL